MFYFAMMLQDVFFVTIGAVLLNVNKKECQNRSTLTVYKIMRLLHGAALQG